MKLILIHGAGGVGALWFFQTQHFKDADAPDLPGRSEGKSCASIEEYADWVHGYIRDRNYKDVVLGGHSLGGGVALAYALKYPEDLKAIILVGSGARLRVLPSIQDAVRGKLNDTQGWLNELVMPMYRAVDHDCMKMLLPKLAAAGPAAQLNDFLCCDKFDVMDRVAEIKLPALAIVGDRDNMTPLKYSQYLVENMPDCRMSVIKGGSHLVFLEKPQEVNGAIEGFLKSIAS